MPRSAWLAVGAVVAAVLATGWPLPAAVLASAAGCALLLAAARRPWLRWAALAAAVVLAAVRSAQFAEPRPQ